MANIETLLADTRYFAETSAPSTPASGGYVVYAKTDGKLYGKNDAGTEIEFGAAGAGGITRSQLGTTSLGASFDTTPKVVMKKITCATAGGIASIGVGVKGQSTNTASIPAAVFSDNSGTPLNVIAQSGSPTRTSLLSTGVLVGGVVLNATARFITIPIGLWVASGDYWLAAINLAASGNDIQLAYASGTGSDRTKASTDGFYNHSVGASSTGTHDFSLFANFLT